MVCCGFEPSKDSCTETLHMTGKLSLADTKHDSKHRTSFRVGGRAILLAHEGNEGDEIILESCVFSLRDVVNFRRPSLRSPIFGDPEVLTEILLLPRK